MVARKNRQMLLTLILLEAASLSASNLQADISSAQSPFSQAFSASVIDLLDSSLDISGGSTYGTILAMELAANPSELLARKAQVEQKPNSPLEPADILFAIVGGGSRANSTSIEAYDFSLAVRRRLGIPETLACSLRSGSQSMQRQHLRESELRIFTLLVGRDATATDVTHQLDRPDPAEPYLYAGELVEKLALGGDLNELLPGGRWLAEVADEVGGTLLSCSGPLAQETQLLFLRAVLEKLNDDRKAAEELAAARETYYSQECSLYPVNKMIASKMACSSPRICLALSGGGVRSAAFQVGVLQGLHEENLLGQVDIISAVSGGAYATGWFIGHRLAESQTPEVSAYSFLSEPALRSGDKKRSRLVTTPQGVVSTLLGLLVTPFEWLRDHLANFKPQEPVYFTEHHLYRRLLSRNFARQNMSLYKLEGALRTTPDIPFPIFAATAHKGDCLGEKTLPAMGDAADLDQSVFEFSALGVGARVPGLCAEDRKHFTMVDAITISGAALDLVKGFGCSAVRGAHIRLGAKFKGTRLADGGFSENLGFFPLVRRSCDAIIISDAEYDPEMEFGSYQRLRAALASKGMILSIPQLDTQVARTTRPCCQGIREDRKKQCFVAPLCPRNDGSAARSQKASWFTGSLEAANTSDRAHVVYLKLALDEERERLTARPTTTIRDALDWDCPVKNCSFPQIPTRIQNLPPKIGAALRELGATILREAIDFGALDQQISPAEATQAEALWQASGMYR